MLAVCVSTINTFLQVVWKPLVLELAKRGHQITFVGPYPDNDLASNPNITYAHTNNDIDHTINSTAVFLGESLLIPIDQILTDSIEVVCNCNVQFTQGAQ